MNANTKTILAISGSLRANSSNTAILHWLASQTPADVNFKIYEGIGSLPHFSPELDGDDAPAVVQDFRDQLNAADAILICTPEYAFGVPGVLKNALDWTVGSGNFDHKPVALITASLSGEHAHQSLLLTFKALNANMIENGTLVIPFIRSKMDAQGNVKDEATQAALESVLKATVQQIYS